MESTSVENWLADFKASRDEMKSLWMFIRLPQTLPNAELQQEYVDDIIRYLPLHAMSRFMLEGDDECVSLVVLALHSLIPRCSPALLSNLRPLVEGIRVGVCERNIIELADIESRLMVLSAIGLSDLTADDLCTLLDASLRFLKENTKTLPTKIIRDFIIEALDCLAQHPLHGELTVTTVTWQFDVKIVAQALLRTFDISDEYVEFALNALASAGQILDEICLCPPEFAKFLTQYCAGRLRIATEHPQNINVTMMVSCLSLLELYARSVESDDSQVDDEVATAISRSCQEAASFICEYFSACRAEKILFSIECQLAMYRFICMFASMGAMKLIKSEFIKGAVESLLTVCDFALTQRDFETARLLFVQLNEFPYLPQNTLRIMLKYLRLAWPTKDRIPALAQISCTLEALSDRKEFYDTESLNAGQELAKSMKDERLIDLFSHFK